MPELEVRYADVEGFPNYRVGSDGSFWSCYIPGTRGKTSENWRQLKVTTNKLGYKTITIYKDTVKYTLLIHLLLITNFIGPKPFEGAQCRHKDGNPSNHSLDNLEWGSAIDNAADRKKHGREPNGEKNGHAVLTEPQVLEILEKINQGHGNRELAKFYNVSDGAINGIKRGDNWKHLPR